MNTNTYDTTPLLDEVISVANKTRVFNDGSSLYPLWFEVSRDTFFCGRDFADALRTVRELPNAGVSLHTLVNYYPDGRLTNP